MKDEELAARKKMSFAQAEGAEALPSQLKREEISQQLRSYLWAVIYAHLSEVSEFSNAAGTTIIYDPWSTLLRNKHIFYDHRMIDEFENRANVLTAEVKEIFADGNYLDIFDFLQWLLNQPECPSELAEELAIALEGGRAAYGIFDGTVIAPISSEEEAEAFTKALAVTKGEGLGGPNTHLKKAARHLTAGNWAESIRESISAVEAVAKIIEPGATDLGPALAKLEKKHLIHGGLRNGFASLYGFTSDEKGIRHSLLEKGAANVDEVDAQFMLGACASFVSYLLARARAGG